MATYKGTLYFSTDVAAPFGAGYGWSENFLLQGIDWGPAWGNLLAIANARKAMLPTTWQITHGKVSVSGAPPDAFWSGVDGTQVGGPGTYVVTPANETLLPASVGILYRMQSAAGHWGMRWLRGVTTLSLEPITFAIKATGISTNQFVPFQTALMQNAFLPVKRPNQAPLYDSIIHVTPIRGGWSRVGRPFGVPAGRARSR